MIKLPIKCSSCGKKRYHYGACDCVDGQLWEINQRREALKREEEREAFNLLRDALSWFDAHEVEKQLGHLPQWVVSARAYDE
jgi:hypothetical protein